MSFGGNMNSKYKVKKVTSLYESCDQCGLPVINCICNKTSQLKTNAVIWILSTEREFYRPSNTARLLKLINPDSTKVFLWERTNKPEKLIENIKDERYEPYLLFPAVDNEQKSRQVEYEKTEKTPAFILIDGTWKEAGKILRKSEYLKTLPIISLKPDFKSEYDLRRGAGEGNLCTIEAAIEALKINNEIENANLIKKFYSLFIKSYKAGVSGHSLKE
jgi:DTW domain-containing protein